MIRWVSYCLKHSQNHDYEGAFMSQLSSKSFNPDVCLHPWESALVMSVAAVDKVRSVQSPHLIDQLVLPTLLKLINRYNFISFKFIHPISIFHF